MSFPFLRNRKSRQHSNSCNVRKKTNEHSKDAIDISWYNLYNKIQNIRLLRTYKKCNYNYYEVRIVDESILDRIVLHAMEDKYILLP